MSATNGSAAKLRSNLVNTKRSECGFPVGSHYKKDGFITPHYFLATIQLP